MPMPPQLARFCFEEQQLYSESLLNDEILHPALRKRPAFKESRFLLLTSTVSILQSLPQAQMCAEGGGPGSWNPDY